MKRLTYEYVKNQIEKEGYKLLSNEYIDNSIKLKVECLKGHQYKVRYNLFQQGYRCPFCCGNKKLTFDFVKEQFEKEGYKLLSNEYKNVHTKLLVECPHGHQYEVRYNSFIEGHKCFVCYSNKLKLKYDYIKKQIENVGFKLLSKTYKNNNDKLKIECSEKHQYTVRYGDFQQGIRCPICWEIKSYSLSEKDCASVVKQLTNENIIENDRTQIINHNTNRFLEFDMWIPSLNKAIEFNGEYWHESNYSKYKDKQKIKQCQEKNIDLLTIWYQDWIDNRQYQIEKINNFVKEVK